MAAIQDDYNHSRLRRGDPAGFYESYFQRANHPHRPLAFWIRYTVFAPQGRPADAVGELWAVWFDGETGGHVATRTEVPLAQCSFAPDALRVRIGASALVDGALSGEAASGGHRVRWDLRYAGGGPPLFFLPTPLYDGGLPRAKSLVGVPLAEYAGSIVVDGRTHEVAGWRGSQNHNWGSRHTDRYAYGQVCGFDEAPGSFLEVATAQLRLGPVWSPRMTPLVLRHDGEEIALNTLGRSLRARGRVRGFRWRFAGAGGGARVDGEIEAPPQAFVGLRYRNPPGGEKHCLNTKLADCRLRLRRRGRPEVVLHARRRAAFELLTDDPGHGIEIRA